MKKIAKTIGYILWWVCLASVVGCGAKTPKLGKLAPGDVVVAFGDSLTFGTGANEAESYPAVLAQLISRKVVRAGVPGEQTDGGLARLQGVLDRGADIHRSGAQGLTPLATAVREGNLALAARLLSRGADANLGASNGGLTFNGGTLLANTSFTLGATRGDTHHEYGFVWTVMQDPEGNEFCIGHPE